MSKQIRKSDASWSREDAERELAKFHLGVKPESSVPELTLSDATTRYLQAKAGKKSVKDDRHTIQHKARLRRVTLRKVSGKVLNLLVPKDRNAPSYAFILSGVLAH